MIPFQFEGCFSHSPTMIHRIAIKRLGPGSAQRVLKFINQEFVRNEPLSYSLGGIFDSRSSDLEVLGLAGKGISIGAFDTKEERLVGVSLATTFKHGEENPIYQELKNHPIDEKFQKILNFVNYSKSIAGQVIHDQLGIDEYVEGVIQGVHSEYAGQGIGVRMFRELVEISKEMKFRCIYFGCTSEYSAKYLIKEGANEILRIPYNEWMQNNVPIFPVEPPHLEFKGLLKWI